MWLLAARPGSEIDSWRGRKAVKIFTGIINSGRMKAMFPDRELIMRSQGKVRFIKLTSRFQILAVGITCCLLLIWLAATIALSAASVRANQDRIGLQNREAKVESAESRLIQYREDLAAVSAELNQRQDVIEDLIETHLGELPDEGSVSTTAAKGPDKGQRTIEKVSAVLPEAAGLARAEARQVAFVERLARYADQRAEAAARKIRELGLNPSVLLASANRSGGQGGPYIKALDGRARSLDPSIERLAASLSRMEALQRSLEGIPQVHPANADFISSRFGYRSDPFHRHAAFHSGLDFAGPIGAPVYAAADGKISFAGQKQGYGNIVEIDHGNGLTTRYAHLSRFRIKAGERIEAGQVIGAIGNTGRSTGPHLHFEVRVHERAVNPRPFLEKALNVQQQEKRSGA